MRERGDLTVLHEPFSHRANYGSTTVDGEVVTSEARLLEVLRGIAGPVFFKDTTDFHYDHLLADAEFLATATHTFLVRDPREAIASHYAMNPALGRDEIGYAWLFEIFEAVRAASGRTPVVVESGDLVADPAGTVRRYCEHVGIPYLPSALSWSPDMVPVWRRSEKWHASTSASTTFTAGRRDYRTSVDNSPVLAEFLRFHEPYYERLAEHRI